MKSSVVLAHDKPRHVLSFDVEEHFQVAAFWSAERRREWDQLASRVERNTLKIADLLAEHSTKATFFILGWVAERHPDLVKQLARQGHEIASHGYGHEFVYAQTPAKFREDVRRSKQILEDLIARPVIGYRAPSFSISTRTPWAIPILVEEKYQYDSSIYNRFRSVLGSEEAKGSSYLITTDAGNIWEIAPSTMKMCGIQFPVAGGGYFRLLPYATSKSCLRSIEGQGRQLVMYLHPWEIDPEQPRMEGAALSKFRHYLNLEKTEQRLRWLLRDFSFAPISEAIQPIREIFKGQEDVLVRLSAEMRAQCACEDA